MKIVGAGLAGLIAAHSFPQAEVVERAAGPIDAHRALLRFRTDGVSRLTGIPFRKVTVRKGIFSGAEFREPTIALANKYAAKCLGRLEGERSIWNLAAAERFIAPDDFYSRLFNAAKSRITFGVEHDYRENEPVISTAPLPVVLAQLGIAPPAPLNREPIVVERYHIPDCDLFQTVYFPDDNTSIYRASITGSTLIIEHAGDEVGGGHDWLLDEAFGAPLSQHMRSLGTVSQSYGKIASIPSDDRRALLYRLTRDHNIYSLGRFATWRNVLLCDLVNDIDVVRRMMNASSYEHRLHAI